MKVGDLVEFEFSTVGVKRGSVVKIGLWSNIDGQQIAVEFDGVVGSLELPAHRLRVVSAIDQLGEVAG